jgi:hypothetical protein
MINMRLLKADEALLIKALLMTNIKLAELILPVLDSALVENMDDGEMGSLLFISSSDNSSRSLGITVAEAEFLDEDGVPVCIALNLDKDSQLFELDVWKVDYSPITRYPDLEKIVIKGRSN